MIRHKRVELAAEVYDRASADDIGQALSAVGRELVTKCATKSVRAMSNPRIVSTVWGLVSAEGIEFPRKRTFNNIESNGWQL